MNRPSLSLLVATALVGTSLGTVTWGTTPRSAAAPGSVASTVSGTGDEAVLTKAEPLLDGPRRGRRAIEQLGEHLGAVAAGHDLRPAQLRHLLRTDQTAWVDPEGGIYFVDPGHDAGSDDRERAAGRATAAVAPLEETFRLHSNPGADLTILLDFDGADVSGSQWNSRRNLPAAVHPAWDPAGNGPAFDDDERRMVQEIWALVVEDFAPFEVDVTTQDPGPDGMVRSSAADPTYGTRVLVSPSGLAHDLLCGRACGGIAYLSVFDQVNSTAQPAWVFPQALSDDPKSVAEAASHEAGHNLGLDHDGTTWEGYYRGHGLWAPIMGASYHRPLSQWSRGDYTDADNDEDDLTILAGYLGRRVDEAPDSPLAPAPLPEGSALVGTSDDVDSYLLGSCAAETVVEVRPTGVHPNLDVRATLHDADGAVHQVSEPPAAMVDRSRATGLDARLTVPAGDGWVLTVDGGGQGSWAANGYDDYGSLGAYTVTALGCDGELAEGVPGGPGSVSATSQVDSVTLTWSPPADPGASAVTGYLVARSGSSEVVALGADRRSHTFTGLAEKTTYRLSVRARNARGSGRSVTTQVATTAPLPVPPGVPRQVSASYDPAVRQIQVRWAEPETTGTHPISGYAVFLQGQQVGTAGASSRGGTLTLPPNARSGLYDVGVAATSEAGTSPLGTATVTVTSPLDERRAPEAPTAVTATPGDSLADVSWTAAKDNGSPVTSYRVVARNSWQDHRTVTVGGTTTSVRIHGLTNGTAYTFVVVATNAAGESLASVPSAAVTPRKARAAKAPKRMTPPKVKVRGRKAVVRWRAATSDGAVTRYLVDVAKGKDRKAGGRARKAVLKKLQPGRHRVRVAARNAAGTSRWSRWVSFRVR